MLTRFRPFDLFEESLQEFSSFWDDKIRSKYFKSQVKDDVLTYEFTLPDGVKPEDIQAEIKDNLVTLSIPLPKSNKEIGKTRKLQLTEKPNDSK